MKFFSVSAVACSFSVISLSLTGCKDDPETPTLQTGKVTLEFDHKVGTAPLVLATKEFTTPAGDQFTVTKFRYYISNIKLTRTDGTQYVQPESYYLVNEEVDASQKLTIDQVPTGDYTGLTFTIGVDSARNVSGVQTGVLAPSDMFWTWKSGYIFLKLEGYSPQAPTGGLTFHIGGIIPPNNTIRTVSPSFKGTRLLIRHDHTPEIHYKVDVLKMFTGPTTVRFDALSNIMGGANAVKLADNYAQGMFAVDHIHAN